MLLLILIQTKGRINFKSMIKELALSKFCTVSSLFNFKSMINEYKVFFLKRKKSFSATIKKGKDSVVMQLLSFN